MTTDPTVRVVVAPGSVVTVPHPSGTLPGPHTVREGESVRVSTDRAQELWSRGVILHPVSGELHPSQRKAHDPLAGRTTMTIDGVTYDASAGSGALNALAEAERRLREANPPRAPEPVRAGRDWSPGGSFDAMLKAWNGENPDPITDLQGRPWPSY